MRRDWLRGEVVCIRVGDKPGLLTISLCNANRTVVLHALSAGQSAERWNGVGGPVTRSRCVRCPAQDQNGEQSDAAKERAPRLCSTRCVHGRLGFVCVSSPCPLLLFTTFSASLSTTSAAISPPPLPLLNCFRHFYPPLSSQAPGSVRLHDIMDARPTERARSCCRPVGVVPDDRRRGRPGQLRFLLFPISKVFSKLQSSDVGELCWTRANG